MLKIATANVAIAAMSDDGAGHVAQRIARCVAERQLRVQGRRPWSCRAAACPWCARPLVQRWCVGLRQWIGLGPDVTTLRVPVIYTPGHVREAVRRFRRSWRDMRDRQGRRRGHAHWRGMAAAGLVGAAGAALLHVRHTGITRREMMAVVASRFLGAEIVSDVDQVPVNWTLADRVALARLRRGIEPLRIVVPAQRDRAALMIQRSATLPIVQPMPCVF